MRGKLTKVNLSDNGVQIFNDVLTTIDTSRGFAVTVEGGGLFVENTRTGAGAFIPWSSVRNVEYAPHENAADAALSVPAGVPEPKPTLEVIRAPRRTAHVGVA